MDKALARLIAGSLLVSILAFHLLPVKITDYSQSLEDFRNCMSLDCGDPEDLFKAKQRPYIMALRTKTTGLDSNSSPTEITRNTFLAGAIGFGFAYFVSRKSSVKRKKK